MKYVRWLGIGTLVMAGIAAVLYATRSHPVGWIAGRQLSGDVVSAPVADWGFSDAHMTIAVETRPDGAAGSAAMPGAAEVPSLARRVVVAAGRSEGDRKTDARRHPVELLRFAGVRSGMRAADLGAGSGYTAELLARAAGPGGVVYGQNTPRVIEKYVSESWPARLTNPAMANVVRIDSPFDAPLPGVEGLDLITMVFVYHDTLFLDVDRTRMNAALLAALRPGGALVLVDHRAEPGAGPEVGKTLHRIDEGLVRRELLAAGFQLAAEGAFLANADDPREQPFFEMEIPTDAFVHRYVKPAR